MSYDHDPSHPHAHHSHPHEHSHGHSETSHRHEAQGPLQIFQDWLAHFLGLHRHSDPLASAHVLETSARGIWALKVSLIGLMATALFQVAIVALSGSVALLADTIHNFSDALTAIPLWIAFALNRRTPSRRYTYGYGRAEDLAGVIIVLMIFASALVVFYESYQKLINPQPLAHLGWVAAASVIGFAGNELVAVFRLRVGREIGSAALIADGLHARVDGITSLGVLVGVVGVWLGFPWADPIVGLAIGAAILFIARDAAIAIWHRLMDAIDPDTLHAVEQSARQVSGVQSVRDARARWVGHRLHLELHLEVDCDLPLSSAHAISEEVRHTLFHALPATNRVTIHLDPCNHNERDHHAVTAHHGSDGSTLLT